MLALERDQLVERIERLTLDAAGVIEGAGLELLVDALGDALGALVAVCDGIAHEPALRVEQNEVDAPGVDADSRGDLARIPASLEARKNALPQHLDVPAVMPCAAQLLVVEAVELLEDHTPVLDVPEHVAPARRADIYGQMVIRHRWLLCVCLGIFDLHDVHDVRAGMRLARDS